MIAFASLLLAQAGPAVSAWPPPPPVTPEVVKERMQAIGAMVEQTSEGGWRCSLSGSTGSLYIDDRLCVVSSRCSLRFATDSEGMSGCIASGRRDVLKDWRDILGRYYDALERKPQ